MVGNMAACRHGAGEVAKSSASWSAESQEESDSRLGRAWERRPQTRPMVTYSHSNKAASPNSVTPYRPIIQTHESVGPNLSPPPPDTLVRHRYLWDMNCLAMVSLHSHRIQTKTTPNGVLQWNSIAPSQTLAHQAFHQIGGLLLLSKSLPSCCKVFHSHSLLFPPACLSPCKELSLQHLCTVFPKV